MTELARWDSLYVIVGSAAGALIGLQFVVMMLIAERPPVRAAEAGAAFGSPTIVHFGVSLLLAALLRAPWDTIAAVVAVLCVAGLSGVAYMIVVAVRIRRQTSYRPVFEDWLFHAALPLAAYAGLASSALAAIWFPSEALFGAGGSVLMLLFTGIHNAWDSVAYHVHVSANRRAGSDNAKKDRR